MEQSSFWIELAKQGGFAVLAAVSMVLMYKQNQRHVDDLKASADREREARSDVRALTSEAMNFINSATSALVALKTSIDGLLDETRTGPRRRTGA